MLSSCGVGRGQSVKRDAQNAKFSHWFLDYLVARWSLEIRTYIVLTQIDKIDRIASHLLLAVLTCNLKYTYTSALLYHEPKLKSRSFRACT